MIQLIVLNLFFFFFLQVESSNQFIEKFAFIVNQYMQALGGIVPIFNYMVRLCLYTITIGLLLFPLVLMPLHFIKYEKEYLLLIEPVREKTNNLDSDQVRHKPACAAIEDG